MLFAYRLLNIIDVSQYKCELLFSNQTTMNAPESFDTAEAVTVPWELD